MESVKSFMMPENAAENRHSSLPKNGNEETHYENFLFGMHAAVRVSIPDSGVQD